MAGTQRPAVVELKIPCRPEFVGVARLAILGVASRMPFSYDEVEDVRLAVGEACTAAVELATRTGKQDTDITIRCEISDNRLTISVADQVGRTPEASETGDSSDEFDQPGMAQLLMELLVDEFQLDSAPEGGTLVRMVKYAG